MAEIRTLSRLDDEFDELKSVIVSRQIYWILARNLLSPLCSTVLLHTYQSFSLSFYFFLILLSLSLLIAPRRSRIVVVVCGPSFSQLINLV
jgi:hypothetical protein